jgi:hypothetical protein
MLWCITIIPKDSNNALQKLSVPIVLLGSLWGAVGVVLDAFKVINERRDLAFKMVAECGKCADRGVTPFVIYWTNMVPLTVGLVIFLAVVMTIMIRIYLISLVWRTRPSRVGWFRLASSYRHRLFLPLLHFFSAVPLIFLPRCAGKDLNRTVASTSRNGLNSDDTACPVTKRSGLPMMA